MKEYTLENGQVIEFTKEGVLLKGNTISLRGDIDIIRDKHAATISESLGNRGSNNVINLDENNSVTEYESASVYQLPGYEYFAYLNLFVFHFKNGLLDRESMLNVQDRFERLFGDGVKILILDETFGG
ncbi:hypothetical protein [Weissella confusa]|uniref:hypothetical protein n=1 Tax=Weissella confusa TaxID=1583 RepID=UPI0017804B1D|nr:hypothetical protein [Weissella confusa]MBD5832680.1 hypothetical protein [Weissella confusa]